MLLPSLWTKQLKEYIFQKSKTWKWWPSSILYLSYFFKHKTSHFVYGLSILLKKWNKKSIKKVLQNQKHSNILLGSFPLFEPVVSTQYAKTVCKCIILNAGCILILSGHGGAIEQITALCTDCLLAQKQYSAYLR